MATSTTFDILPGYSVTEVLHESLSTIVYRGQRASDQTPVVIKLLKNEYPTLREITRFRHEYSLTQKLAIAGVVKSYDLIDHGNGLALILEDFGGISLKQWAGIASLELKDVLNIAIQLTQTLGELHGHHIIHKDIKPSNIIFNPQTEQVKLTDFSVASQLQRENPGAGALEALEGTLNYMSPEQTGRMNRAVDYRSDFYSLGITLYELLTGQLPFQSDDPMELVHSHIARTPVPPHQLNPAIPQVVSDLVMKLLAKTAEERYQTTRGLEADLQHCLEQLETTGAVPPFLLAQCDRQGQFHIPEKLYGRETEVQALLAAFDRICDGAAEMILVRGYSGIGKSALVHEVHKPMVRQRGYFIAGKFDQFKRNIPYSALVQAFRDLIQQLLTGSEAQIHHWQAKLMAALEGNGQVIIDVIPEIELIIGPQPPVEAVGLSDAQNRFHRVFRQFIRVFAAPEHPLVLFLDDLQWADAASFHLIHLLVSDSTSQGLLVVGAYRENEVNPTHCLMQTLEEIRRAQVPVQTITLQNLAAHDVTQLIADTLSCPAEAASPLTELVLEKTQGNPFFLTQLLRSLYEDGLLRFDAASQEWQWNLENIRDCAIADNVVEFMIGKIQKLPAPTQRVLMLAACIGNRFDLRTLATVAETRFRAIALDLWPAIQNGLIVPIGHAYRIAWMGEAELDAAIREAPAAGIASDWVIAYRFAHDRVQQAAHALIPNGQKQEIHLKIGRLLLHKTPPEALDEQLFDIINALNLGIDLLSHPDEHRELADLNLRAGRKAKLATAYGSACSYLSTGLRLLPDDCWSSDYGLALALHTEAAEVAYLTADYSQSEALTQTIQQQARNPLDQVKAYELKIQYHMAQLQMAQAIQAGLEALERLGIPLASVEQEAEIQVKLPALSDLATVPELTEPHALAALHLLRIVTSPAYQAQPETFKQLAVTQVQLCIQQGHAAPAAFAYVAYGWFMCGRMGNIELGYQAGQIALCLLEQFNAKALQCSVYQIFETFIRPWKEPLHNTLNPLLIAIQVGQETGDIGHVSYCAMNYCTHLFLKGEPLDEVERKQSDYIDLLSELQQEFQLYYTQLLKQVTLNLKQPESSRVELVGESFDETQMIPRLQAASNHQSLFAVHVMKLILACLFEDYPAAIAQAEMAERYAHSGAGLTLFGTYRFYYGLALLACCSAVEADQQQAYVQRAIAVQQQLKQWAEQAPANYQHKLDLMEAELARIQGDQLAAMEQYDRAIQQGKQHQYLHEEALAHERAASFYQSIGKTKIAQVYLTDAYYGYMRWGAVAKVKDLETRHAQLLKSVLHRESSLPLATCSTTESKTTSTSHSNLLDLHTVLKASQTISSEIVLSNLLEQLIRIVIQNAGAQRGLLIARQEQQWRIEAEGCCEPPTIQVLQARPVKTYPDLALSVVNYVARTQSAIVLDDARSDERFATDAYVLVQQPKSVLCFPVLHQGQLKMILYLENNLTTGAFTPDRIELLKVLMAQISISLENAMLYTNLQTYSQQLEVKSQELELKNEALQQSELREREKAQELTHSLEKLKQTQAQLVQTEKISSLGQLVAGIAHEVNNPVGFISGNLKYAQAYVQDLVEILTLYQQHVPDPPDAIAQKIDDIDLDYVLTDLAKLLTSMKLGTDRIREIMLSLRTFSRIDSDQKRPSNIHEGLESTLLILQHRLKANACRPEIRVVKQYGDIPPVHCFAGQLNQVFMNLLANAIDALDEASGKQQASPEGSSHLPMLSIQTALTPNGQVQIRIADNGPGIPPEIQTRLFDAFFTTKAAGKGTGLGLSISQQIITEQHGGHLCCHSMDGQGTEFVIEMPLSGDG